ncbi:hypothetical protein ID866_8660 [Astraeus odoratus]|nr:hypothetical protein ID866_8660 [Astraeus odoratus]
MLITSSEPKPDDNDTITGYHRIWDTETLRRICELDTNDVGDAMAITPDGSTLALITAGPQNSHPMRLYDIRRSERKAYEMEELEGGRTQSWSSVDPERSRAELLTCARFSADGRLLAIARNDNRLHIYDIRALSKGPLCRFEHYDLDVGGQREFGIIEAVWVEGKDQRRIGILSGGNDGCVRLWEPSLAPCDKLQGTVVGSTDFDVAHFSIGDGWRGEIPMVIGDSGGGLHTYDLMDEEGCAIQRSWPPGR